MSRKIMLLLGGIVLFVFIFVTSIAWSKIFYGEDLNKNVEMNVLNIQLARDGNHVNTTQEYPQKEAPKGIQPYTFKVTNKSYSDSHYQILLEEEPVSNQVGYRQEDLLKRDQLNYSLVLNGKEVKNGRLSSLKNNVLDERVLQGTAENQYRLTVWVHDQVKEGEWENKYYHYKVTIKVLGE